VRTRSLQGSPRSEQMLQRAKLGRVDSVLLYGLDELQPDAADAQVGGNCCRCAAVRAAATGATMQHCCVPCMPAPAVLAALRPLLQAVASVLQLHSMAAKQHRKAGKKPLAVVTSVHNPSTFDVLWHTAFSLQVGLPPRSAVLLLCNPQPPA